MKTNKNIQFVESVNYNNQIINIYIDDAGQSYLLEYIDKDGSMKEISCGSYNTDYNWCIEELFGHPIKNCSIYNLQKSKDCLCAEKYKHGFCDKCMYANYYMWWKQHLIKLGLIDNRLCLKDNNQIKELFLHIFEENFPKYFMEKVNNE